jgi:hypothetical protein
VVRTLNITPVANKLHLADALANSEETKNLAEDNGRCGQLLLASVADGLRLWEVLAWVLDDGLEVLLEGGDVSVNYVLASFPRIGATERLGGYVRWAHLLLLEDNLGHLKADLGVVDSWWDLSYRII